MKPSQKTLVSIINWNNSEATHACLESIALIPKSRQPDVYLVDNHSVKEPFVLDPVNAHKLRSLILFKNTYNAGFSGGHNVSIAHAINNRYDFVCLLNNDTVLQTTTLFESLASAIENEPDAIAAAPTIVQSLSPPIIWFAGGVIDIHKAITKHSHVGEIFTNTVANKMTKRCTFLTGCCLMIALQRFPEVNKYLDESYFLYWEDADWCARALTNGAKLLHVGAEVILHNTSTSLGIRSAAYGYYNVRNRLLFARKRSSLLLVFIPTLWTGIKIMLLSLKSPATVPKTVAYVLRALFDGVRGKEGAL